MCYRMHDHAYLLFIFEICFATLGSEIGHMHINDMSVVLLYDTQPQNMVINNIFINGVLPV